MPVEQADWTKLFATLKRKTDIDLSLYKQDQLRRRIGSMLESKNLANLDALSSLLEKDPDQMRWFLDKLAINVSELWRNPEKWGELENKVIPDLLTRSKNLKCWSAGCSFGAEAHTLAAILDSRFHGTHTILGTDIDFTALEQAKRGEFIEADMRGVPPEYRTKYFEKTGEKWLAKPQIRKILTFKQGNLLGDRFDSGFDLIMCRNVVIYFTDTAKEALYLKFYNALKPGGTLFVGSTERIFNAKAIGFETPVPFFYQRPMEGQIPWRNAS